MESEEGITTSSPRFLEMLSPDDVEEYNNLKESLSSRGTRNRRGKRLEAFADMLGKVKEFSIKGDENDWKRCLVCGVCWIDSGIAINTRQLRLLIDKCKSSINGSLHRMGYSPSTTGGDTSNSLVDKIPLLKGNFSELRQWTVRQQCVSTPQPLSNPILNTPNISTFYSPAPNVTIDIPYNKIDTGDTIKFEPDENNDPFCLPMNSWPSPYHDSDPYCLPMYSWPSPYHDSDPFPNDSNE